MTNSNSFHGHSGAIVSNREFTEKWLQALTLAASHPAARKIRPLFSELEALTVPGHEWEQLEIAARLWDFVDANGLLPLLAVNPYQRGEWRFDGDEAFVYEHSESFQASSISKENWIQSLGLGHHRLPMIAVVNQDDWSELLRIEAIRLRKPLKVNGPTPAKESMLWMNCEAEWDRSHWTMRFTTPEWVSRIYESGFEVVRPPFHEIETIVYEAIELANKRFGNGAAMSPVTESLSRAWMQSIPVLNSLHERIFSDDRLKPSPWFLRTWSCVWPVIYREQNRLRGPCDIDILRRELEICFRTVPQLTVWMFCFAKLICIHQLGSGIGICGDFC